MDMVDAGLDELLDPGQVPLRVGAADDALAHRFLGHELGDRLEVGGDAQLRQEPRRNGCRRRPLRARDTPGLGLVVGDADGQLAVARLALAAPGGEGVDELGRGRGRDQPSPIRPANSAPLGPPAATTIGGGSDGRE